MLERNVTVSRAAPGVGLEAVFAIIRAAHPRNALAGLTGGLIFLDGWFVQVTEGLPGPLAETRRRVAGDPRHRGVEIRARERALCRLFPGQAMALRTRACLDPGLLEAFGYAPGFPVTAFPADDLVEFVLRACRSGRWQAAAAGTRRGAPGQEIGPGIGPERGPAPGRVIRG